MLLLLRWLACTLVVQLVAGANGTNSTEAASDTQDGREGLLLESHGFHCSETVALFGCEYALHSLRSAVPAETLILSDCEGTCSDSTKPQLENKGWSFDYFSSPQYGDWERVDQMILELNSIM
eukprot:SAG11_NODE_26_length_23420_cov_40.459886_13_plen_123_part_00